jgi:hypothetical protein
MRLVTVWLMRLVPVSPMRWALASLGLVLGAHRAAIKRDANGRLRGS